MPAGKAEIFLIYQMGNSDEWTWFSPVAIFLSEGDLREYARKIEVPADLEILTPDEQNEILLSEPQDFVLVRAREGEVPDVDLKFVE